MLTLDKVTSAFVYCQNLSISTCLYFVEILEIVLSDIMCMHVLVLRLAAVEVTHKKYIFVKTGGIAC